MNAPGFNTYQHCHVESWDNEKALNQRHNTAGLYGLPFLELVESNKTFKEICSFISVKLGVTPFSFHILRQSSSGKKGAKETLFKYHQDQESGKESSFITVIIKLTDTLTSMQVAGYDKFTYEEVGSAAVFYSGLWHKSIHADENTIKIALFCKKNNIF